MSGPPAPVPAFPYEFDPLLRGRARAYERGSLGLTLFAGTVVPLTLALGLLLSGLSRALADGAFALLPRSPGSADALYIVTLSALASALTLPLALYGRHFREKRFAMTRRSLAQFLKDALKSAAFATVVAVALLVPLLYLIRRFENWWVLAAILYAVFLAFSTFILPNRNDVDLDDLPKELRDEMTFVLADRLDDVLAVAMPEDFHMRRQQVLTPDGSSRRTEIREPVAAVS